MIYIRTKDGVYELKENMTIENGVYSFFGKIYDTTEKHLFRNDKDLGEFVSQSENLEELCDRAFAFHKDSPWESPDLEDFSLDSLKEQILESTENTIDEFIFKLAIWTSKGLIYVAKMNSEGKLVLE